MVASDRRSARVYAGYYGKACVLETQQSKCLHAEFHWNQGSGLAMEV